MTFDTRTFQTAAHRRAGRPIPLTVQDWQDDGEGGGALVDVTVRIDPRTDVVRVGAAFAAFGRVLQQLNAPDGGDTEAKIKQLDVELARAKATLREMIVPHDRAAWDQVAPSVDTTLLGMMVRHVQQELSGMDPTQQASSSDGSAPTGLSSTDGVPPAV
jgi:hypothetical protein